jgi:predicted nucleic acid-binding protein
LSEIAYIDASAFSEILAVEAFRAAVRIGGDAPAAASRLLRRVVLLPLSSEVRERACRIGTPELRALDAIHLATALSQDAQTSAIFTYDKRLAQASADAGLRVLAPA